MSNTPYIPRQETTYHSVRELPIIPERLSDKRLKESEKECIRRMSGALPIRTYADRLKEGFKMLDYSEES